MNTLEYLQAVKTRLCITSDYALAKALKVAQPTICSYRSGRTRIDDDVALKIAEILELNPLQVIAAANAERSKSPEMRAKWMGLMERVSEGFRSLSLHAKTAPRLALVR